MKKRLFKIATLAVSAVALVVVTVLVTVAYLTSFSTVSNTFTVGKVGIHMYESSVDEDGKALADTEMNGLITNPGGMKDSSQNTYTLIPGKSYDKDPTIYVGEGSAGAYLFVVIKNEIKEIEVEGAASIEGQMTANGWVKLTTDTSSKGDIYFYAKDKATGTVGSDVAEVFPGTYDVFSKFTIRTDAVVRDYVNKKVELTAYAIQADTFVKDEDVTAAHKAWLAIAETYPDVKKAETP